MSTALSVNFLYSLKWPNGVMPYVIDAAFTEDERAVIAAGIADMEAKTCVRLLIHSSFFSKFSFFRFVPRTDENSYVDIIPGNGGCYAYLPWGYVPDPMYKLM